jgi:hypothetical protein
LRQRGSFKTDLLVRKHDFFSDPSGILKTGPDLLRPELPPMIETDEQMRIAQQAVANFKNV